MLFLPQSISFLSDFISDLLNSLSIRWCNSHYFSGCLSQNLKVPIPEAIAAELGKRWKDTKMYLRFLQWTDLKCHKNIIYDLDYFMLLVKTIFSIKFHGYLDFVLRFALKESLWSVQDGKGSSSEEHDSWSVHFMAICIRCCYCTIQVFYVSQRGAHSNSFLCRETWGQGLIRHLYLQFSIFYHRLRIRQVVQSVQSGVFSERSISDKCVW